MEKEPAKARTVEVSGQELQVLHLIRQLGYGQLVITVRDGRPCLVEEIRRSIQFRSGRLQSNRL